MNNENYNMNNLAIKTWGLILLLSIIFLTPSFGQQMSSDVLLKQALKETNINKNYKKAIALTQKGLKISPDYLDLKLLLGRLYMLNNRQAEAELILQSVLKKTPSQSDALRYLINLKNTQKNTKAAIAYAAQYLKYYPSDRKMELKKLAMQYENGDYDPATQELEQLMQKYPADADFKSLYENANLTAGQHFRKQNDMLKATEALERVLKVNPNQKDALFALYNLNIQQKNFDKALEYAQRLERNGDQDIVLNEADLLRSIGRYDDAIRIATKLRTEKPDDKKVDNLYHDVLYAKGKHALEQKDTLTAQNAYEVLFKTDPADTFSRNQLVNIAIAQKKPEQALNYLKTGRQYYQDQEAVAIKTIAIAQDFGTNKEAYTISKTMYAEYPNNEKIRMINNDLFVLTRQNRIGINYGITAFDQSGRKPWNLYSAFYMRTEENGSLIARVNYADRKDARGYQFEVEAYPTHNKGYSYINFAYSNALIFPKFRFSYSYFLPLAKDWETEVGVRYLNSYFNYVSFTAGIGKYFGKFWLNGKTFLTPNGNRAANSYVLSGRYFMNGSNDDYITAIAGYGFSPDDRGRNFEITERLNLESIRLTLGYQRTLWKRNILGIFGTWNNQEYIPGKKRNEFDAQISFQHKF